MSKLKITLLPNTPFLKEDETYDLAQAENFSGKAAGVCYDPEGWERKSKEAKELTDKRIHQTLSNGHHSVFDHAEIGFNFQNISKILAMFLNNERQYTTSEKSARYTQIKPMEGSMISERQIFLYEKWNHILLNEISRKYYEVFYEIEDRKPKTYRKDGSLITTDDRVLTRMKKLAQENARYMITVFMPTQMLYTTSLRQINYIASWMEEYIEKCSTNASFEEPLKKEMQEFLVELKRLNVIEPGLQQNEKRRQLSLIGEGLEKKEDFFGEAYGITYKGSFAELAQAQRHRTIKYQMQFLENAEFYVPPILEENDRLALEWLADIQSVQDSYPQGQLLLIREKGFYEDFILKCKERLCSAAQLEIMEQTRKTREKYYEALLLNKDPLAEQMKLYRNGARCTFPDYDCPNDCHFKEGKTLVRKI